MVKPSELADAIKAEMNRRGWEQAELARRSLVSAAALSRFLGGGTQSPGVATLDKIAKAFGMTTVQLLALASPRKSGEPANIEDHVLENDPELRVQFHRMANAWEDFTEEERRSVIDFIQFVEERHRKKKSEGG